MKKSVDQKRMQEAFGRVLRELREESGRTQEIVADLAGITNVSVSNFETGEFQPKLFTAFRLAKAVNVTPTELIQRVELELNKAMQEM